VFAPEHRELSVARTEALGELARRFARLNGQRDVAFLLRNDLCRCRVDEKDLAASGDQALEQSEAVRHARCASESERNGSRRFHHCYPSSRCRVITWYRG